MKIVNNCIDCVCDFQMRESYRDKLVHAMPTDLIAKMASVLVIKPYGDKFYVVKSRYGRELLYNILLKEDFKVISNSDFEGCKDWIEFAKRVRELINPGECIIYKMNNKKFDENYELVRNTNYSTNIYSLYKMVMKRDPRAIDEIESLEEAKEIIGMMLGNHYVHNTAYEMLKIFGGKQR